MTDFFTHVAGQLLQPSTEIYPAITVPYAPGPDVPGASLVPEPSALDSTLQPDPPALADPVDGDEKGVPSFDHPVFPSPIDVETIAPTPAMTGVQTLRDFSKSLPADSNDIEHSPAETSRVQRTIRRSAPVPEPPALNADPAKDEEPSTLSTSVRPMPRADIRADASSTQEVAADQALPKNAEGQRQLNEDLRPAMGLAQPETLPLVTPHPTRRATLVPSALTGSSSLETIHPAAEMADPPAAASQFPAVDSSPAPGVGKADPIQTMPLAKGNNSGQMPLNVPAPVDPPVAQANAELIPVERASAMADLPRNVPAAQDQTVYPETKSLQPPEQSPRSEAFNPHSTIRPVIAAEPAAGEKTNISEAENNPNMFSQPVRSSPKLEASDPPDAKIAGFPAASSYATVISSSQSGADRRGPIQILPWTEENSPAQTLQNVVEAQAQTVHSETKPLHRPGQSPRSPALTPNSTNQPLVEGSMLQSSMPLPKQRAMSKLRSQTLPLVTSAAEEMALPLIPLPPGAEAKLHSEEETRRSNSVGINTLMNKDAATTASRLLSDHAAVSPSQAERATLLASDARQSIRPGRSIGLPARSPTLDPTSIIRPVIKSELALSEKTNSSHAESAGTTVPTVRLTIGRIVVKAGPPTAPAASTPVSTRRQPSVSLSDYIARHGSRK